MKNTGSPTSAKPAQQGSAQQILESLRQRVRHCESLHHSAQQTRISSGCEALDELLPQMDGECTGGFRSGQLVEWLSADPGSGAATWAMQTAVQAMSSPPSDSSGCTSSTSSSASSASPPETQFVAIIDQDRTFYPPAAAALGIDLKRLLVIQPRNASDALWALDQTLRCPVIAAAWARIPKLAPRDARRLQLAAESGNSLGLLLRPLSARGKPSWANVQLQVESVPLPTTPTTFTEPAPTSDWGLSLRRYRICLLRCRGAKPGNTLTIEHNQSTGEFRAFPPTAPPTCHERCGHETHSLQTHALHLAAQLARPATGRRSARA